MITKDDVKISEAIYNQLHARCCKRGCEYIIGEFPYYKDKLTEDHYREDQVDIFTAKALATFVYYEYGGNETVSCELSIGELLMEDDEWTLHLTQKLENTKLAKEEKKLAEKEKAKELKKKNAESEE